MNDMFREKSLDGETVVWSGQPGQGIVLARRDAALIPFSLMWGGFAVFWETSVLGTDRPIVNRYH